MDETCKIRIYDEDFNWLDEIHNAESVQLTRKLYGIGTFEIHIHPDKLKYAAETVRRDNIIVINRDGHKSGLIRDFYISETRGKSEFVIYGETGSGMTAQRLTVPPNEQQEPGALGWDKIRGSAETVIKHYAGKNMVTPYDLKRKFQKMIMSKDLGRGIEIPWKSRYYELDDELFNIGSYCETGYELYADTENKRWVFEVIPGVDRTKHQNAVSPVSFNLEYRNVSDYKYTEDYQNYRNTGYAGGAGEDEKRLIYTLGSENEGLKRHEVFLDCGQTEDINELIYYGEQKLGEYKEVKRIEAQALPRVFIFGRDYFLGDKVTVYISRLGLPLDTRITEVKEIWERGTGYRAEVKFGGELPNLFTILDRKGEVR